LAYENLGFVDKAVEDYGEAIRLAPQLTVAFSNRVGAYTKLGKFRDGVNDLNLALDADPESATGRNYRGVAVLYLGEIDKSLNDLTEAYVKRAAAYAIVADLDTALNDYDEATSINFGYIEVYLGRGSLHDRLGGLELAISYYAVVISPSPELTAAYINPGVSYHRAGQDSRAVEDFDQAIAL